MSLLFNFYFLNKDQFIFEADGTYCFLDKPSDNELQRRFYCENKKSHCAKPMVFCATDGRIIDVFGPYLGSKNDADIFKKVFSENSDLIEFLQPSDVAVLDREFRNCRKTFETTYGLIVKTPTCN